MELVKKIMWVVITLGVTVTSLFSLILILMGVVGLFEAKTWDSLPAMIAVGKLILIPLIYIFSLGYSVRNDASSLISCVILLVMSIVWTLSINSIIESAGLTRLIAFITGGTITPIIYFTEVSCIMVSLLLIIMHFINEKKNSLDKIEEDLVT